MKKPREEGAQEEAPVTESAARNAQQQERQGNGEKAGPGEVEGLPFGLFARPSVVQQEKAGGGEADERQGAGNEEDVAPSQGVGDESADHGSQGEADGGDQAAGQAHGAAAVGAGEQGAGQGEGVGHHQGGAHRLSHAAGHQLRGPLGQARHHRGHAVDQKARGKGELAPEKIREPAAGQVKGSRDQCIDEDDPAGESDIRAELGYDDRQAYGKHADIRGGDKDGDHDHPEGPPPMVGAEDAVVDEVSEPGCHGRGSGTGVNSSHPS